MPEVTEREPETTSTVIDESVISQIVENRASPLEVLRETLSNSCASEVGASEVLVSYYRDPNGTCFKIKDDGCGMGYSGDSENPKRLDKFKNLGFSEVSGIKTDEYGYKGLGSKLLLDCRELSVKTWNGKNDEPVYELRAEDPRSVLIETDDPKAPKFDLIRKDESTHFDSSFTDIEVKGYAGGHHEYDMEDLELYLYYNTIVGCTKEGRANQLPDIYLNVGGKSKKLEAGFPWIKEEDDWKTVTIDPPISKTVTSPETGTNVTVTLKGGFTLNTGKQKFGLSPYKDNVGIFASVNGIPYFELPYEDGFYGHKFKGVYKKYACFVVECEELDEILSINRSDYNPDGDISSAFKEACRKCFTELASRDEYQRWHRKRKESKQVELAEKLEERKKVLGDDECEYICLNLRELEDNPSKLSGESVEVLHTLPDGENDTLALLWKLEALGALPFEEFSTLEHTNQRGIDIIARFKEDEMSELKQFCPCEIEHKFENYKKHEHYPGQTSMILCWEIEHPNVDGIEKVNEYEYYAKIENHRIPVYELKNMPGIEIRNYGNI